jgi:hypothetical protein
VIYVFVPSADSGAGIDDRHLGGPLCCLLTPDRSTGVPVPGSARRGRTPLPVRLNQGKSAFKIRKVFVVPLKLGPVSIA